MKNINLIHQFVVNKCANMWIFTTCCSYVVVIGKYEKEKNKWYYINHQQRKIWIVIISDKYIWIYGIIFLPFLQYINSEDQKRMFFQCENKR